MRPGAAVVLEGVSKSFRISRRRPGTGTLKSEIVDWLRGRRGAAWTNVAAIRAVSLAVGRGETLGLIGRNGSGKSTLLRLIAGIHRPDAGSVSVEGRVSTLIELGAGFHPEITGRENVVINGMILGLTRRQILDRYDAIVRFAELEPFMDAPVRTYSSGMYARLGFSVAVHVDPEILLVDEVLAVGDEAFLHKCKRKFDELRAAGKTIVLVTHDLTTVEQWCDRAAWLESGRLEAAGGSSKVVEAYRAFMSDREREGAREPGETPSGGGRRWGDRQIEITRVEILDREGKARLRFETGEAMRVVVSYRAPRRVEDIVFGVGLLRSDGLWCFGTNTAVEGFRLDPVSGEGSWEVSFPSLDLVEGRYTVDVAAHDRSGYAYDYHAGLHPFEVWSSKRWVGVFRPSADWKLPR